MSSVASELELRKSHKLRFLKKFAMKVLDVTSLEILEKIQVSMLQTMK